MSELWSDVNENGSMYDHRFKGLISGELADRSIGSLALPDTVSQQPVHTGRNRGEDSPVTAGALTANAQSRACKRFFQPLDRFIAPDDRSALSGSQIPASLPGKVWRWLDQQLAPHITAAMRVHCANWGYSYVSPTEDVLRSEAAQCLSRIIAVADKDRSLTRILKAYLELDELEPLRNMVHILQHAPILRLTLDDIPENIEEFDDVLLQKLCEKYERASAEGVEVGIVFLYDIMHRLDKSWKIIKLMESICDYGNSHIN